MTQAELLEEWNNKTLADNFIFYKVMTNNPEVCRETLEILLNKKIKKINFVQGESTFTESFGSKGIRLDVYIENSDSVYDLEIQTTNNKNLIKRARYYQGIMDVHNLKLGENYSELKESYVLFLCTFDPFGLGKPIYTIKNIIEECPEYKIKDDTFKIFYNAKKCDKMLTEKQKEFFNLLLTNKAEGDFSKKLKELIFQAKQNVFWRKEYMMWGIQISEQRMLARKEGLAEGRAEGRVEGIKEGRAEGRAQGIKEGRAEGIKEKTIEAARALLAYGDSAEKVSTVLNLPLEKVLKIQKEIENSKVIG